MIMINADHVIQDIMALKELHTEYVQQYGEITEDKPEYDWWVDEFGCDLTIDIDCPHYDDDKCLCEKRQYLYGSSEWYDGCAECKARWLMEEYE